MPTAAPSTETPTPGTALQALDCTLLECIQALLQRRSALLLAVATLLTFAA
jgi:hypothetical protein